MFKVRSDDVSTIAEENKNAKPHTFRRWSFVSNQYIVNPRVNRFVNAIEALCKEYELSITHATPHGAFIITDLNKNNLAHFNNAFVSVREKENELRSEDVCEPS